MSGLHSKKQARKVRAADTIISASSYEMQRRGPGVHITTHCML